MIATLLFCTAISGVAPSVDQLVEANSSAIGLLRSIDVEYEHDIPPVGQGRVAREHWLRDGSREHFWSEATYLTPTPDGRPTNLREWVLTDDEYRLLLNWDPRKPQKIRPAFQGTVRAEIGPRIDRNPTTINPAYKMLLEIEQYPRRTLSELVASAAKTTLIGTRELNGHSCWVLQIQTAPEPRTKIVDVWLDPSANFMVARRIERDPEFENAGSEPGIYTSFTVLKFKDCGDGVFFPMHSEIRGGIGKSRDPEQFESHGEIKVVSLSINPDLDDSQFQLHFPLYAGVRHLPVVDGVVDVDIWGEGKPLARVHSRTEIEDLEEQLMTDPQVRADFIAAAFPTLRAPGHISYLYYVVATVLGILLFVVVYRRLRPAS